MRDAVTSGLNRLGARARARRAALLLETFPHLTDMTVLDLGGEPRFWSSVGVRPARVVAVNTWDPPAVVDWVEMRRGDATNLPDDLRSGFDLVFSNSVIEHVGGHEPRTRMAAAVREAGTHYWVQTPNRWFLLEPHFMLPGIQFLPAGLANQYRRLSPTRPWKHRNDTSLDGVLSIELLTARELEHYFPDARIIRERVGGLTKSLIATR